MVCTQMILKVISNELFETYFYYLSVPTICRNLQTYKKVSQIFSQGENS